MAKLAFASDGTMVIDESKIKTLNNNGYMDRIDLKYLMPYKYYNYDNVTEDLETILDNTFVSCIGVLKSIAVDKSGFQTIVKCKVSLVKPNPETIIYVNYFGAKQMAAVLKPLIDKQCLIAGNVKKLYGKYFISNPMAFDDFGYVTDKHLNVYRKFRGISDSFLKRIIKNALSVNEPETIPKEIREAFKIPNRNTSIKSLHFASSKDEVMDAVRYHIIEDMLYLACMLEREKNSNNEKSSIKIDGHEKCIKKLLDQLDFKLTNDQKKCISSILKDISLGEKIDALVQGDVGCGKSIVAFIFMLAFAERGYQSVLMAPTVVLATQHFNELEKYANALGFKVAFLGGHQTEKQKRKIVTDIESGEVKLIVGTHSCASSYVNYNNLGLTIVDEEQRFGVEVRRSIIDKGNGKAHNIRFSATPIPRSMAQTIYGNSKCYEIKELPAERKPVKTILLSNDEEVIEYVRKEVTSGGQAYIVCPLIESDEGKSKSTVKEVAAKYQKLLDVPVGTITGKQDSKETKEILEAFKTGVIKVLVATTVIEVGISNDNANTIVIEDAYNFGLSQLHQLRGRVGRGCKQGYCVLHSSIDAERLNVLCETTDGFVIANKDLELRGAGNLLGLEQSGQNRFILTAMQFPKLYASVKNAATKMVRENTDETLIYEMGKRSEKAYVKINRLKYYET